VVYLFVARTVQNIHLRGVFLALDRYSTYGWSCHMAENGKNGLNQYQYHYFWGRGSVTIYLLVKRRGNMNIHLYGF